VERFVIENLGGVNRNNVDGVGGNPDVVKGFSLKRTGGYIPLGGINDSWLGERELSLMLLETSDYILMEDSSLVATTWRPAAALDDREQLAYDEHDLTLLTGPAMWVNNHFGSITSAEFQNQTDLFIVPRSALVSPWQRTHDGYIGKSYLFRSSGGFTTLGATSTATFTENAGTGLPADTYEVLWLIEGVTDNGTAIEEIGRDSYTVSATIESLTVSLSEVYEEGTAARFYYRPSGSATMERFAIAISDGQNAPSATLGEPGTDWLPTEDVIVNFGPGRLEAHNGRVWGKARPTPFIPFLSDSSVTRSGGFMMLSEDGFDELRQYGSVASGDNGLKANNDYIEFDIKRFYVKRTRVDKPVVVGLFDYYHSADADKRMWAYFEWATDNEYPHLKILFTADGTTAHTIFDEEITLTQVILGTSKYSSRDSKNIVLRFELDSVTDNGDGSITSEGFVQITGGAISYTQTITGVSVGTDTSAYTDWTAYTASANQVFALGKLPTDFVSDAAFGNRELRIKSVKLGNGAAVDVLGDIEDYDPTTSLTTWTSSSDNAETWTTNSRYNMVVRYGPASPDVGFGPVVNPDITLVYSSVGAVNRGTLNNFLVLSPLTSTSITGLASTPAGLLVFMENETFLVRGDPATQNLNVQRLSGTVGNDRGVIPARMGSVVMPIYRGEIYAINLGGGDVDFGGTMVNISTPVWLPSDPFIQVVGEPVRNHLVGLTRSGKVYRLDTTRQSWLTDIFSEVDGLRWLSAACDCGRYGTRYNVNGYFEVVDSSLVDTPEVEWRQLDFGVKDTMKLWRRVEVFTRGTGDGVPELEYEIRGFSGSVTGLDNGDGRWVFTLPRGLVGPTADLKLKFPGATTDLVVEPPVVIEYAIRYRER